MKKDEAEVMVVTRTKNREVLLARTLASVSSQKGVDWLHVVVNDGGEAGPVDRAIELASLGSGRRIVIHNASSVGMEAASIMAVQSEQSEFIALLDDDDTWSVDYLSKMVSHLKKSGAQGVACHAILIHEELVAGQPREISREIFNPTMTAVTLFANCKWPQFTTNGFVFRRSAYMDVGGFNPHLPVVGDWDFNVRFLSKYDIDFIPEALAFYHVRKAAGDLPNSNHGVAGVKPHDAWMAKVLNEKLRDDLRVGVFGLGALMNIAQELNRIEVLSKNPLYTAGQELKDKVPKRWASLKKMLGL